MGGTAYLILGELSPSRLEPQPIPRNLLDKLLGRQRYARPSTHNLGERTLTDVPCKELERIPREFVKHMAERLPQPSEADDLVLSYLKMGVTSVYLRQDRGGPDTPDETYLQIGFSGCAGMAEVCAMIACHWFDRWYVENAARLNDEILTPFGFTPNGSKESGGRELFLPVADIGYVAYVSWPEQSTPGEFELDGSVGEDGRAEAALDALNREFASLLADGECRCTLCHPGFQPVQLRI